MEYVIPILISIVFLASIISKGIWVKFISRLKKCEEDEVKKKIHRMILNIELVKVFSRALGIGFCLGGICSSLVRLYRTHSIVYLILWIGIIVVYQIIYELPFWIMVKIQSYRETKKTE